MSITLAIGTQVQIASAYGSEKSMTALSNDLEAIGTLASSHGIANGDYFEITSGWGRINGVVARTQSVVTNDVTFEGINTADTTRFPAGSGIGSVREISAWTPITQLTRALQVSGGGQNYADVSTMDDPVDKRMPTTRSAIDVTIPLYYDPSLAWWADVLAVSQTAEVAAVRFIFPNGSKLLASAYWSLQEVPTIEDGTLRTRIDLSFASIPTTYAT